MGEFKILRFVNPYKKANTFVIELNHFDIVIIDFGNYPIVEFMEWITRNKKNIIGLVLTHEHADHCYGIDLLKTKFDFTLYCSEKCEINMRNPKQNYSRYIEDFDTFGVKSNAVVIQEGQVLNFKGFELTVLETPGHSPGSICLFANDIVFTGDTLLNNNKSPLSFPNSNKKDYQQSILKLKKKIKINFTIYPGHGESCLVSNFIFK